MIDVNKVRARFPALAREAHGRPAVYFDNPAGTQVPREVLDGFDRYLRCENANTGGEFPTSQATDALIAEARRAMADFLGTAPEEIAFGQNMTTLTYRVSHALERMLQPGDEVVTTRLEHDANIAPWLSLEERGVVVRWIDLHEEDGTLDMTSAERVIGRKTRLVAAGYASNLLGTVNDVHRLIDMAHAVGAWAFIDAVHFGPHGPIDARELDCDLLVCSAYKFFGPHLGILTGRYEVLETLPPPHVRPVADQPPDKWETGTLNHESLAGLLGTIAYLESLGAGADRRSRLRDTMTRIQAYERTLSERLIGGLTSIRGVRVYGITDPACFDRRVPTASFQIERREPDDVARALAREGIFSWSGNHYALEPLGRLGLSSTNRVGLAHYNTAGEVDRFLEAVAAIAA